METKHNEISTNIGERAQKLETEVETKQAKAAEEAKEQAVAIKAQVLKIATALKAQSLSLKAQGENITELRSGQPVTPPHMAKA